MKRNNRRCPGPCNRDCKCAACKGCPPTTATGPTGPCCTGPTGPSVTGPTGFGVTGPTGPCCTGPTGPSSGLVTTPGLLSVYSTSLQPLDPGEAVAFENFAIPIAGTAFTYNPATGEVTFNEAGIYDLTYELAISETGEFAAVVDGVPLPSTRYRPSAVGAPPIDRLVMKTLLEVTEDQVLTVRNIGADSALLAPPLVGNVSALMVLTRVA